MPDDLQIDGWTKRPRRNTRSPWVIVYLAIAILVLCILVLALAGPSLLHWSLWSMAR
jgi:hypothetical protein